MNHIKIFISIFILSFLLDGELLSNAEEGLPKVGFVKDDGASVRAGDNINFESLCELEKDDPVKIIDRRYSWFKIALPKKAYLYIKTDYVDLGTEDLEKGEGIVNALHVNLRGGPGIEYSILGQVSKPERVSIVSKKDGWYKIEPPKGTAGWIHSSHIKFNLEGVKDIETKKDKRTKTSR